MRTWRGGGCNPGLHVCSLTGCFHYYSLLASPPVCLAVYLTYSFAWKQGKGSGRERITYGCLDRHLATHHITSKHRARHSMAWHGTHNNKQLARGAALPAACVHFVWLCVCVCVSCGSQRLSLLLLIYFLNVSNMRLQNWLTHKRPAWVVFFCKRIQYFCNSAKVVQSKISPIQTIYTQVLPQRLLNIAEYPLAVAGPTMSVTFGFIGTKMMLLGSWKVWWHLVRLMK